MTVTHAQLKEAFVAWWRERPFSAAEQRAADVFFGLYAQYVNEAFESGTEDPLAVVGMELSEAGGAVMRGERSLADVGLRDGSSMVSMVGELLGVDVKAGAWWNFHPEA